jgi:hypothetical protein
VIRDSQTNKLQPTDNPPFLVVRVRIVLRAKILYLPTHTHTQHTHTYTHTHTQQETRVPMMNDG